MTEYEIQPLSFRCARTRRELKPGEIFFSVLSETPEGFNRLDFAEEAWTGPPEGAIGSWKSKVPVKEGQTKPRPIDDSVVLEFFERCADDQDSSKNNFRYILALHLLRRKVLRFANVEYDEQGAEILVLRGSEKEFRVINPGLNDDQIAEVQAEVMQILHSPVA